MPNNLLNNQDFIELKKTLDYFDPFRVLGVGRFENRHSNVIGWLLDPKGNHQMGEEFINNFLRSVLIYNDCLNRYKEINLYSYHSDKEGGEA